MSRREGLSLLEVILALAILGGSLAVIGELMRLGSRNAATARDLSTAEILAETKMSELAAGLEMLTPVNGAPFDSTVDTAWVYDIQTQVLDDRGLTAVQVVVRQAQPLNKRPVSFSLDRWLIDPLVQAEINSMTTTGSTGSTPTGSSGS